MEVLVKDAGRSECLAVMVRIEVAINKVCKLVLIKITSSESCADFR